jgi:hypothetical protein
MPPIEGGCTESFGATTRPGRHRVLMNNKSLPWLLGLLAVVACASDGEDDFSPLDERPAPPSDDSKSDEPRACGTESCAPRLCGYDCTVAGSQCERGCAAADGRAATYVQTTFSGAHSSTLDTRQTPFEPVFSLDNVLIYGCNLWDFSNQQYDGLEIEVEELVHSSFVVNPSDPTRHDRRFVTYIKGFTGPGSYRGEALFLARHDAQRFSGADVCSIDVAASATGGIEGTFDCTIPAKDGSSASVGVRGEFACAANAMLPIFVRRVP